MAAMSRLSDVAKKVGVSEATVSRVLNGRPGASPQTREAVLTALDVLGYERPTKLRGARARMVGLVLPELSNPIFPAFADVVGTVLAQRGCTPVLCTRAVGGMVEEDYIDMLLTQNASGIIFAGGNYAQRDASQDHYRVLSERKLPVVLVNAAIETLPFPSVVCDDAQAMEQAIGHLVSLGHSAIGLLLGPVDHVPSERKLAAARSACARRGVPLDEGAVVRSTYTMEGAQAAAQVLLDRGVTAIVCASDPIALGAIRAAQRAGRVVPRDLSVVGYDDSALMNYTDPPLTTVRQPIDRMGRAAVELLLSQDAGEVPQLRELLFDPELVVRGSTAVAPAPRRITAA